MIVSKYRIYCNTEQDYVYTWNDSEPTVCPHNNEHSINTDTIVIVDNVSTQAVDIKQESIPTGGHYRVESRKISIKGNTTGTHDLTWPYQLSVLTITIYSGINNEGDILNLYVAPDTTIGYLTQSASESDTIIHVNSTVLSYISIGYIITLNNTKIGECIYIDKVNSTITLDTALPSSFSPGSLVKMTVNNVKNFVLRDNTTYELARKTIGSSAIPPGTVIRIAYTNNTTETKNFYFSYEYMY